MKNMSIKCEYDDQMFLACQNGHAAVVESLLSMGPMFTAGTIIIVLHYCKLVLEATYL